MDGIDHIAYCSGSNPYFVKFLKNNFRPLYLYMLASVTLYIAWVCSRCFLIAQCFVAILRIELLFGLFNS